MTATPKFPTVGNLPTAPTGPIFRREAAPQMEFDWEIGHNFAWLLVSEISAALRCSPEHVSNLIFGGALDVVIDIKAPTASRPSYRILRHSFFRWIYQGENAAATDLETALQPYFKALPAVLSAEQTARHLRCTDDHVLNLSDAFTDISAPSSNRKCLRVGKPHLWQFIQKRRIA